MKAYNKFFLIALICSSANAKDIVTGETFKIVEPDAEKELMNRVNSVSWDKEIEKHKDTSKWQATKTFNLPIAKVSKTRLHVPFYKTPFDIKDQKGNIIYEKGYTFNPLQYVKMPNKLYILTPETTKYFAGKISNMDQIIIANGNPLDQREIMKAPVFGLDKNTAERLGVKRVPSIVWQKGAALMIEEISVGELEND